MSYDNWKLDYPAHYDDEDLNGFEDDDLEPELTAIGVFREAWVKRHEPPLRGFREVKWDSEVLTQYRKTMRSLLRKMVAQMRSENLV